MCGTGWWVGCEGRARMAPRVLKWLHFLRWERGTDHWIFNLGSVKFEITYETSKWSCQATACVWALNLFCMFLWLSTLWRWGYYPYFIDWETEAKKGEMDLLRVTQLVYGFQTPWSVSSAFYHAAVPLPVFPWDEDTDVYRPSLFPPPPAANELPG